MDFDFSLSLRVVSGSGIVRQSGARLSAFGKRCLIVTGGKSAVVSGALNDVTETLEKEGVGYAVFNGIGPNPLLSACFAAGCRARETQADFLIGIGGGSVLDATKAAAVYAANPDFTPEDIYTKPRRAVLPFVLIGTTAGTGSEVGRVAVLTIDASGRKKSIAGDDLYPALTLADPGYTASMPFSVTVSTALDALSHAVEGACSPKCGDIPLLFAERAVALLWRELTALRETRVLPDAPARERLYYGSLYAGITLAACGTAFPHPMGYILTENYGTPHGFACAAFLPEFMERAARFTPERCDVLLRSMGTELTAFCETVRDLYTPGDIRMTAEQADAFCARWDESIPNNFKSSPGGFTKEDALALLKEKFCQ